MPAVLLLPLAWIIFCKPAIPKRLKSRMHSQIGQHIVGQDSFPLLQIIRHRLFQRLEALQRFFLYGIRRKP